MGFSCFQDQSLLIEWAELILCKAVSEVHHGKAHSKVASLGLPRTERRMSQKWPKPLRLVTFCIINNKFCT